MILKINANRIFILTFLFILPTVMFSQNHSFPKDTIYVQYEDRKEHSWNDKFERIYDDQNGIYFNVEQKKGDMALFYPFDKKSDTLSINCLNTYQFSNRNEIDKKREEWIFDHDRPPLYKNDIFQTYVIEVISEDKIVKYPVVWRNEGTVP